MQIPITKIVDANDLQFIIANKVSHVVGWGICNMELEGVNYLHISKSDNRCPSYIEMLSVFKFIEYSKEQHLCSLIYSQKQNEAAILLIPYFMIKYVLTHCRFRWNLQTALHFINRKINILQFSQSFQQSLVNLESNVRETDGCKSILFLELKNIQWTYNYLAQYKTHDQQELIVINTVKNSLTHPNQIQSNQSHSLKRVSWKNHLNYPKQKNYSNQNMFSSKNKKITYSKINNKNIQLPKQYLVQYKSLNSPLSLKEQANKSNIEHYQQYNFQQFANFQDQNIQKIKKRTSLKKSKSEKLIYNKIQKKFTQYLTQNVSATQFIKSLKTISKTTKQNL